MSRLYAIAENRSPNSGNPLPHFASPQKFHSLRHISFGTVVAIEWAHPSTTLTFSPMDLMHTISIATEVVGVFQREGKPVTTLIVRPFTIEVDEIADAHLGDEAALEISFSIHSIRFQPIR